MSLDLHIAFDGMDASPSIESLVRRRAGDLARLSDRLSACRVVLEAVTRHHRQGMIYRVRIELSVPGGPVVINREPGQDHAHEDAHVAVQDAFDAARRRLQDHMRRLDGRVA